MEFNEKLQELRKRKGLTQEELAEALYVSRTAISKWESGRGFPNIESLKAISKYFSVSLDELLSSEEVLTIAEKDKIEKVSNIKDLVFGLFDCGIALLMFLPFFGQSIDGSVRQTSLLGLSNVHSHLAVSYYVVILSTILIGVCTLALQNCKHFGWTKSKSILSLSLSAVGVMLFISSRQAYAAIFVFVFFIIKVLVLLKRS